MQSTQHVPHIPRVVSSLPRRTAALQALVPGRGSRILRICDLHAHLSRPGGAGRTDTDANTHRHTHTCVHTLVQPQIARPPTRARLVVPMVRRRAASRQRRGATADAQPDLEHVEGLADDHPDAARHYARHGRAELFAVIPLKVLRRRAPPLRRRHRAPLPSIAPCGGALAQAKRHSTRAKRVDGANGWSYEIAALRPACCINQCCKIYNKFRVTPDGQSMRPPFAAGKKQRN